MVPGMQERQPGTLQGDGKQSLARRAQRTEEFVTIQPAAGSRQAWPVRV